ncbi:ATP-binding protein [Solicola gregarius]|uniref:ATP-binding protein n=1 Tax=Solicola gregarius TaxID=2908642 RepID=A0AA46TJS1_9ACTN|nr:ATP-binding protein [Solicola gregarius]UYM06380.1 ATP-binding protein [Solicola gregarius]
MNPFTPTFGTSPPLLVGRDRDLDEFRDGLYGGPGSPERATLVTGLRGTGKTVMLNAYEDAAASEGWLVISETATRGLIDRITHEHLPRLLIEADPRATESHLTAVSFPGGLGVEREVTERHTPRPGLRSRLTELTELLAERGGSGVLLTVDEVHRQGLDDLRILGATIQHAFRERREVAFVGAGLPSAVDDLLSDDVSTFLRRADRRHLRTVGRDDVAQALAVPIRDAGRDITPDALQIAVNGTGGYPFLIQLVGLHIWRADPGQGLIDVDQAQHGVDHARRRIGQLVHASALADLSTVDRSFLAAMAHDDGPSRTSDLATRLNVDRTYVGQYRRRLIAAEVIEPRGYGLVDFTLPGLRDYLREHAASSHWASGDET